MDVNRKATPAPYARAPKSPPRTPRAGTKRNSGTHQTPRDNFFQRLNDNARGADGNETTPPNTRISHDLSLTANTGRSSVVDNMLLSLNPDHAPFESPPYSKAPHFISSESPRSRGHIPTSSLNSDYSFPSVSPDSQPGSHRSPRLPRGRRSNSSNFQSLSRIDSLTTDEEKVDTRRAKAYQSQRAGLAGKISVPASRSGKKSNKSSGSSSVDFGQMMRQSALSRRSASFDDGHGRPSFPMSNSQSGSVMFDNAEAAPTPTIPSGPRSPSIPPSTPPPVSSKKGFRNTATKKSKADVAKGMNTSRSGSLSDPQHMPPPASNMMRSAGPAKDGNDSQDSHQRPPSQSREHIKERPGFLRRVFMSSRTVSSASQELATSRPLSSRNSVRFDIQGTMAPPAKPSKSGLSTELVESPKPNAPPTLSKKPSSFFRRRKKSVSENHPAAMAIPALNADLQPPEPFIREASSVSSLRELMNPYLSSSPEVRKGSNAGRHDTTPKSSRVAGDKSTIRPVFHRLATESPTRKAPQQAPKVDDLKSANVESAKVDVYPDNKLLQPGGQSFLHDKSSNETGLNGNDSPADATQTLSASEQPMGPSVTSHQPNDSRLKHSAPTINPSIKPAELVVDYLQASEHQQCKASKLPRSRTLSGDDFSLPAPAEHLSVPANQEGKETVVATVTPDEAIPRVWLRPEKATQDLRKLAENSTAADGDETPQAKDNRPTSSKRPRAIVKATTDPVVATASASDPTSPDFDVTLPFREDRVLAQRVFEGDESLVAKSKAAAWLGETGPDRGRVRRAYMELFDWQSLNILAALRDFCGRLLLKGETQQVDRILDAFSSRWCTCNPDHGFKATDVVHTVCYSILLLNTDLHMAEIEQKMTRAQFIKNTLPTIRRVAADAAPDAFESKRASTLPTRKWTESPSGRSRSPSLPRDSSEGRRSYEARRPSYRLSSRPSDQAAQIVRLSQSLVPPLDRDATTDDCGPLVKAPFHGKMSAWEAQIEIVLKDFFTSIRQQRLPLHKHDTKDIAEPPAPASNSLSAMTSNMLRRTPSMLSKAGSEHTSYRGRSTESRFGTGRWASKTRSRPRLYPSSTVGSSRTSLEDQSSAWTPSASSTWSKYSLGKTQTSMSVNSDMPNLPSNDYQQSIGFANALSQAIIREEGVPDSFEDVLRATPLLEDESLELAGAPWAKEGILKHKRHLEAMGKKARDRNWVESFAVIEKGWMRLFSFNMNAKSLRQKAKHQKAAGGVVGGGNWMDSAEDLGKYLLRQTIASALPPPGYSKTRPHVWALSLPDGAVHLFQVGTPEIVKEFVTTANYWSARLSKEPLVGGISNIEYGWSDSVINLALIQPENRPPSNTGNARPSLQSSIRSSLDQGSVRPKLPGDRIIISDWSPPQQSMVASVLLEVDQLKALSTYVKNIEDELQKHNELRSPMLLAFSTRHPNSTKAMANWERKSSYLLREIVKFRTYIDCLQTAQAQKEELYASIKVVDETDAEKKEEGFTGEKEKEDSAALAEPLMD